MKAKIFFFIGLVCLFTSSCTLSKQESTSQVETIQVDFNQSSETLSLSEITSSVQSIPLHLSKKDFIGEAGQAYIDSTHIFILDRKQKKIFCFNDKGSLLHTIEKRGKGPEEYLDISHFWIQDNKIYIADNKSLKINIYTLEGSYVQTISHQKIYSDLITDHTNALLGFTSYYVYGGPNGLWKMNRTNHTISTLLDGETKYPVLSIPWRNFYFHKDHSLGLFSPQDNTFYTYRNDSLYTDLKLDIKQKTAQSFPGVESCTQVQEGFYFPIWFIHGERYLLSVWGYLNQPQAYYLLYSHTDKSVKIFKELLVDKGPASTIGIPVASNLHNCLVTWTAEEEDTDSSSTLYLYHLKE